MKANLNSFPEINCGKKIEALAEAIRLLKNERSIDKIDCEHTECRNCTNHKYCDYEISSSEKPNKSIEEKCPCYDCEYFVIDGLSHCKIYEGAYGDCRCKNYHKVNQGLNKVNQDLNKSEKPTSSDDCIDRKEFIDWINVWDITPIIKRPLIRHVQGMPSVTPQEPVIDEIRSIIEEWKKDTWTDNLSYECMIKIAEIIDNSESEEV